MAYTSSLNTVPQFTFYQNEEYPINVLYYNGSIALEQGDNSIQLAPDELKELFKAILKFKPEAEAWLSKR